MVALLKGSTDDAQEWNIPDPGFVLLCLRLQHNLGL
jgi:hypothetical protein